MGFRYKRLLEIMNYHSLKARYDYLTATSADLGQARSREGCDYAQNNRDSIRSEGPQKFYNPRGLKENAELHRIDAKENLRKACGICALRSACGLAFNLEKWEKQFPVARRNKDTPKNIETRQELLRRINKNYTEPCDPSRIDHSRLLFVQLSFDF